MRVLIIGHGHPSLRAGGAERAAYTMFQQYKDVDGIDATFLATTRPDCLGHDGDFGAFRGREDEIVFSPPPVEFFRLSTTNYHVLEMRLRPLLEAIKPDVVHFHHYITMGLESLEIVRRLTNARIFLTLHEFIPICVHNGQMVKRESLRLCQTSSPAECSACFPDHSAGKFFLRKMYIQRHFDHVDAFFSPSEFLRQRFIDWGIEAERIHMIENFLPSAMVAAAAEPNAAYKTAKDRRLRIGFFGQMTPYKGADILLEALAGLDDETGSRVEFIIFGAQLDEQPPAFREKIESLIANSAVRTAFIGSYQNEDVVGLMQSVDFVVVPSIWWENSPLVIQEAKLAGVPMIVSNIGGMAEKVEHGENGFHFQARSPFHLGSLITEVANGKWRHVRKLDGESQNTNCLKKTFEVYAEFVDDFGSRVSSRRA